MNETGLTREEAERLFRSMPVGSTIAVDLRTGMWSVSAPAPEMTSEERARWFGDE